MNKNHRVLDAKTHRYRISSKTYLTIDVGKGILMELLLYLCVFAVSCSSSYEFQHETAKTTLQKLFAKVIIAA